MVITPGRAAHDRWCAEDDWDELDGEARGEWEDAAQAGIDAYVAGGERPAIEARDLLAGIRTTNAGNVPRLDPADLRRAITEDRTEE